MSFAQEFPNNGVSVLKPKKYVGFETITDQIESRLLKRGFNFNIMAAGRSGMGKSTLINTLFSSKLTHSQGRDSPLEIVEKTTEIKVTSHILTEGNVRLNVNVIDTPGFGDQINNKNCWDPLVKYVKEQHSNYLRKELVVQRERIIPDTRVHCVLYFIPPSLKRLRPLDVHAIKLLLEVSNVVPVIAKADSLTLEERLEFRKVMQQEFVRHNLEIYPHDHPDLFDTERQLNEDIQSLIPFAVVGSEKEIDVDGVSFRGRKALWGFVNIEDVSQCDFVFLRDFLMRTHLQDLIETTGLVHYESFRQKQLHLLKDQVNATRPLTSTTLRQT